MAQKLSIVKGLRSRLRNRLVDTMDVCDAIDHVNSENRDNVEYHLNVLIGRADEVRALFNGVLNHKDLPEEEEELEQADELYARMAQCTFRVQRLLKISPRDPQPTASASDASDPSDANSRALAPPPSVVLVQPPILDTSPDSFTGDRLKYRAWKASFDHWIKLRTTASDTDRFLALLKFLEGPPRALLQNLEVCDASYTVATSLLDANYGHTQLEVTQLRMNLLQLPHIKSADDLHGLSDFVNHLEGSVLALAATGIPLESYAVLLETAVCGALPSKLLLALDVRPVPAISTTPVPTAAAAALAATNNAVTTPEQSAAHVRTLIAAIRAHIRSRELALVGRRNDHNNDDAGGQRSPRVSQTNQDGAAHGGKHQNGRTAGAPPRRTYCGTAAGVAGRARPRYPCLFCKSVDHASSRCNAPLTYSQRCEVLNQLERCLKCFMPQHKSSSECRGPKGPRRNCHSPRHYTAMHSEQLAGTQAAVVIPTPASGPRSWQSLVMTASASVVANGRSVPVRMFIDPGSNLSFVRPQLVDQLGGLRPAHYADLRLQAFASTNNVAAPCFNLCIEGIHAKPTRIQLPAYSFDFAVDPPNCLDKSSRELIKKFASSHPLADPSLLGDEPARRPAVLIGMDAYRRIVSVNKEVEVAPELVAKESHLGWLLGGSLPPPPLRGEMAQVHAVCCAATLAHPARAIERLWSLETLDIINSPTANVKADDAEVVHPFSADVRLDNQEYTVTMPKKASIVNLANNFEGALRRLRSKRRTLARTPEKFARCHSELMAIVTEGRAIELKEGLEATPGARDGSYFMPHHEVVTQAAGREKRRIVLDCSAAATGETSLNAHHLAGPSLKPDFVQDPFYFRFHSYDLAADVAESLRLVATLYDPLGRLLSYSLRGKPLIRQLQENPLQGDGSGDGTRELAALQELLNPRLYGSADRTAAAASNLHIFVDASEDAYVADSYLPTHYADGDRPLPHSDWRLATTDYYTPGPGWLSALTSHSTRAI